MPPAKVVAKKNLGQEEGKPDDDGGADLKVQDDQPLQQPPIQPIPQQIQPQQLQLQPPQHQAPLPPQPPPPPQPQKIVQQVGTLVERALVDVPYCYLMEKSSWTDFKRALNTCGFTWNLSDWMHTVVYQGKQYKDICDKRPDFAEYFVAPVPAPMEAKLMGPEANKAFINLLGFPKNMGEYIKPSMRFCNLEKMDFEPDTKLPARQKMWSWISRSLYGPTQKQGPFFYLTSQVGIYDISYLFKRLWDVMETVTICSLDDEVYNVTHLEFDPTKQDLFQYLEELRRAVRRLDDLNDRLPEEGRVILSENYIRSRLIRAARKVPMYKTPNIECYRDLVCHECGYLVRQTGICQIERSICGG